MGSTVKKVNFLLEEDVRNDLEATVPSGRRSGFVNEAIRKAILRARRRAATERLDRIKSDAKPVTSRDLLAALRKDRGSH